MNMLTRTLTICLALLTSQSVHADPGAATTAQIVSYNAEPAEALAKQRSEIAKPDFQAKLSELKRLAAEAAYTGQAAKQSPRTALGSALETMTPSQRVLLIQALIDYVNILDQSRPKSIKDDILGHYIVVSAIVIYLVAKFYDKSKAAGIVGGFVGFFGIVAYGFGAIERSMIESQVQALKVSLGHLKLTASQQLAAEAL